MPLHSLFNLLYRKVSKAASAYKEVPVYEPTGAEDAKRLKNAKYGDWTMVQDLTRVGLFRSGEVPQSILGTAMNVHDQWNEQAGNPRALAGLGPQSPTATQDQIIQQQVSQRIAKMQYRVVKFTQEICEALLEMVWDDAFEVVPNEMEYEDTGVSLPANLPRSMGGAAWTPGDREGDKTDYALSVRPYSMVYQSPQERMAKLEARVGRFMELLPALQAAGGNIDVQELANTYAEFDDEPRIKKLITFQQPSVQEQAEETKMPGHTVRENVRKNVPTGGTPESRSNTMQQMMFANAGQANQGQVQGVIRPGGV
jgi:hypothetical protein